MITSSALHGGRKRSASDAGLATTPTSLSDAADVPFEPAKDWKTMEKPKQRVVPVRSPGFGKPLPDDGYSWMLFDTKVTPGAKFPRFYFRCMHHCSHGCTATKQAQRSDDDITLFDAVYFGEHTCVHKAALGLPPPDTEENVTPPTPLEHSSPWTRPSRALDGGRKRSASDAGLATTPTSLSDAADVPFETAKDWKTMEKPKNRVVTVRATAFGILSDPQLDDCYSWSLCGFSGGSKFTRAHYRCMHSGCPATKQARIIYDDPTLLDITYDGRHTCDTQEHAGVDQSIHNFLETPTHAQAVSNGSSWQSINVGDGTNARYCVGARKRMTWTEEEDLILVNAWLSHSNDPTESNYKMNDQFWEVVTAVHNKKILKERARKVKQVKRRFEKIKKALKTYGEEQENDGSFMFNHCWEVLHTEPKWGADHPLRSPFEEDTSSSAQSVGSGISWWSISVVWDCLPATNEGADHRIHSLEEDTPSPAQPTSCSKMPQQSNTTCAPLPLGLPPPAAQQVMPPSTYEPSACSAPQAPKHMGLNTDLTLQEDLDAHEILEMTVARSRSKPAGIDASAYSAPTAEDAVDPHVQARGANHCVHNLLEEDTRSPAEPTGYRKMPQQSNTTCAPSPLGLPPPATQHVTPPSTYEPGACSSPQAPKHFGINTDLTLQEDLGAHEILEMTVAQSRSKPAGIGASAYSAPAVEDAEDPHVQARGVDKTFHNFLDTPTHAQAVSNGSSSQSINVGDGTNARDCVRTKKRLSWTEEEDLILVSAWLSHSNDPNKLNYKKNEQFWEAVTAVYNNKVRKERSRKVKQVKDHFEKIKKALKTYEEEHKNDGPFVFEHCWEVLCKEPKWDDYLKRLRDEPQIGGKQAKKQKKRERKEQASVIDLEDEHDKVVDAHNTANEGHREMLEIQRHVPSENLEARMIARDKDTPEIQMNAAKEQNELLKMYYSLMMKDTTGMSKDEKSEHVLALKFFREKLSGKPE
ncbi:hypothetical protein ACP70R_023984 [Stipagrostis hirtigluma subsp. patula]